MILSASSAFFEAMFQNEMKEKYMNEISLKEIDGAILKDLVKYCYTGQIDINNGNVHKLMAAASMYQINSMEIELVNFYRGHLSAQNCLSIWGAARQYVKKELDRLAFDFACEHFIEVLNVNEFLELEIEFFLELLKDNELEVNSEEDVFDAIDKWIQFDVTERKKFLGPLIETLRMSKISYQVQFN